MRRLALAVCVLAFATSGCARERKPSEGPTPARASSSSAAASRPRGPLCDQNVRAARLPDGSPNGRWGVELDLNGAVVEAHEARFAKKGITPNGEAWAGLLEQCLAKTWRADIHLDPEAGALHAWVESDASKDYLVAALCRAVDDASWLDQCLASIDRSKLDD